MSFNTSRQTHSEDVAIERELRQLYSKPILQEADLAQVSEMIAAMPKGAKRTKLQSDLAKLSRRIVNMPNDMDSESAPLLKAVHVVNVEVNRQAPQETARPTNVGTHMAQTLIVIDPAIERNEALIAQRGIRVVLLTQERDLLSLQQSVGEVNEIFRNLGTLVSEQEFLVDNIVSNVENTVVNAENANSQLESAHKSQRSANSWLCWIFMVLAVIVSIILLIYFFIKR